jgi:peptide deformylase
MTAHPILVAGHPLLRQTAQPVTDPAAPEIADLIQDLYDSLEAAGGIGLAAPQIGVGLRVVLYSVPPARCTDWPGDGPQLLTILINPVLTVTDPVEWLAFEACLSVPGLGGQVPRPQALTLTALDRDGQPIVRTVSGFHARVLLHECDHLDGRLYFDHLADGGGDEFKAQLAQLALQFTPESADVRPCAAQ